MINLTLLRHLPHIFAASPCAGNDVCSSDLPQVGAGSTQLHQVLQIVFGIVAALAVLMIVIGGFRMITAQGNPQEVSKGRSTVIYALIGLLIALVAEALVAMTVENLRIA